MQLGTLLSRFDDQSVVLEILLEMNDLALMSRVQTAAKGADTDVGAWAYDAVGRFIASAGDEQWLGLVSVASKASDPGMAALRRMLEVVLQDNKHTCRDCKPAMATG
ncbi:hypothetical protein [Hyphomicrobium sp. LHD-15]|uniref:hypothetical protein n=1 Tax=Hyphomicrobium sp. LHD-15 TaxID=3072142 RepID=UPI00280FFC74|nr:hypothetical protein [Hyphomicrobium sp. LHD-15]MDQ8698254.1 hypothetical protein [Hyphomicrobium sp. LHD-15]